MTELHWETHPGDGPPLLLVHGFLTSRAQWLPNLDALGEVSTPIVVELWGHGRSPSPAEQLSYTPAGYVDAFESIRSELGVERWFLCGYSLGAGLTIRYALTHPERVIAQVFTNSTSGLADTDQVQAWQSGAERAARDIIDRGVEAIERIPVHPRFAKRLPDAVRTPMLEDAAMLDPLGVANTLRFTNPNATVRAGVAANTVSTLLACGRLEQRFESYREYAAAHMPLLEIADLDAGHAVNIEAADAFNSAVVEFFKRFR